MRSLENRVRRQETLRLGAASAGNPALVEEAVEAWAAAWEQAERDDDGPNGNRAAALRELEAQLVREAAAIEARRAARLAK
jgi:hypothetical protein